MNPQTASNIRTLLKIIGTILATHGATKAAGIVNSEDFIGLVLTASAWLWSHRTNSVQAILAKADKIAVQQVQAKYAAAKAPMQDIGHAGN